MNIPDLLIKVQEKKAIYLIYDLSISNVVKRLHLSTIATEPYPQSCLGLVFYFNSTNFTSNALMPSTPAILNWTQALSS